MVTLQERTVSLWNDQIQARVKISGEGPPLVFFHGLYGLAWDSFLEGLARHHTVYAPEHPGTTPGDPDAIKALDDWWDLVLYNYELFDALGLESPDLVGHSFGGMVAAEAAATNPDRAGRLVLISPLGLWRDDTPVKNPMALPKEAVPIASLVDPSGQVADAVFGVPDDPDARMDAQIQSTWTLACTGKFIWPFPDKGLKKRIHRIKAPTLIVWGKQDGLAPPVYAKEFADRISGARVELVDGASHMPHLEQTEVVSRIVAEFLKS